MRIRIVIAIAGLLFITGCGSSKKIEKSYTLEDKTVFELIDRLNKNPNDKQAAALLPQAYDSALEKRKDNIITEKTAGSPGDRWMEIAKQREVCLQMYNAIKASAAASKVIPNPKDPAEGIVQAKQNAAEEYYTQGLQLLDNNNREDALKAHDLFTKANKAVPGYKDVNNLLREAADKGMLRVVVRSVDYYRYAWSYWGYNNDWLQEQIVRDLNAGAYTDVRFFSDWEAQSKNIPADKVVEISFPEIYIGNLFTDTRSYTRTKNIQTGSTKSDPPRPVYTTVSATVYVTRRYMQSRAELECRIYDFATGNNTLYDRFPRTYDWVNETARYTGDNRALEPQDYQLISNNFNGMPGRNEVAQRLIKDCYFSLINRIRSGVKF